MITEEDFIDFTCPYCSEPVSFPKQARGALQQCPMCFESVIAPERSGEPGRAIPVPFSTERLTLRRLESRDWKDLLEFVGDEQAYRYMAGHPLDEDAVLQRLEQDAHIKLATPDQPYCLGITLQEGGKLIGYVNLFLTSDLLQGRFTVHLNAAFQKKGFAQEALKGLLRFCFRELKLHRVFAAVDSRNAPAIKLLERLALRREGEFVKDTLLREEWTNTTWYAALREEHASAAPAA